MEEHLARNSPISDVSSTSLDEGKKVSVSYLFISSFI